MVALIANNSEAVVNRLNLQPGVNSLGRAPGNHHVIPHHSVSSRHCEIVVGEEVITLRDLGSTNGTFVDDKGIEHSELRHGQRLRLGSAEFVLEAPAMVPQGGPLRVNRLENVQTVESAETPRVSQTVQQAIAAIDVAAIDEPGFYRQLSGAFAYPLHKNGLFLLGLGAVFFLVLALVLQLALIFRATIQVFTVGYMFAYMQRIISSSAMGEDEIPDFPDVSEFWSDVIVPFLLFSGTCLVSFAPVVAVVPLLHDHALLWPALWGIGILCGLYFPMALLAVAVSDNFVAVSPHIVVPSILRVLVPYAVACVVLGVLVTLRFGLAWTLGFLPIPLLPTVIDGFVSLYLLIVEMRILGLLFRCYRPRLGWM